MGFTEKLDAWFNRPDENRSRGNWPGKLDYAMVSISYLTGIGNIWLFPFLFFIGGGLVYLIPFLFWTLVLGVPLYCLEASLGQFAGEGPITVWNISPVLKGIGYCTIILAFFVTIFHGVILAWTVFYFFGSFVRDPSWTTCGNWWNSYKCNPDNHLKAEWNFTTLDISHISASQEHFNIRVMMRGTEGGEVQWELFGCLLLVNVIVFFALIKGVRSLGKVSYVTTLLPYPLLLMLLVRGLTLPGGATGVSQYLIPTNITLDSTAGANPLHALLTFQTWSRACKHVMLSLGAGFGAHVTFASYNRFNYPCHRTVAWVYVVHVLTCVFSGLTIFSLMGHSAHLKQQPFREVAGAGPSMAFQSVAATLASVSAGNFWCLVFFLLLFIVGLGPQVSLTFTIVTGLKDGFPALRRLPCSWILITAAVCVVCLLLGIPLVSRYSFDLMGGFDAYGWLNQWLFCACELLVISWVYGFERFSADISLMIGSPPFKGLWFVWGVLTPLLVILMYLHLLGSQGYQLALHLPVWGLTIGWLLFIATILPIPLYACYKFYKINPTDLSKGLRPDSSWGPALEEQRTKYLASLQSCNPRGIKLAESLAEGEYEMVSP